MLIHDRLVDLDLDIPFIRVLIILVLIFFLCPILRAISPLKDEDVRVQLPVISKDKLLKAPQDNFILIFLQSQVYLSFTYDFTQIVVLIAPS